MLSRSEIDRKCTKANNGVCDMLAGHDGPCRSANGYVLRPLSVGAGIKRIERWLEQDAQ